MESAEGVQSKSINEVNSYAVYIFNPNKYVSATRNISPLSPKVFDFVNNDSKSADSEESSVCLSLLQANLEAEQETVVRCHLLKNLPVIKNAGFVSEGKYVVLKYSDEKEETFGCYYHHLSKECAACYGPGGESNESFNRTVSFICLIGHADKGMESFCDEFGSFCIDFLLYLDPEGSQCQKGLLDNLQHWHFYCVKYIERCIETFKDDLIVLFQSSLTGTIDIKCEDDTVKSDLIRFAESCSLNKLLQTGSEGTHCEPVQALLRENSYVCFLELVVTDGKIHCQQELSHSSYCQKWIEKLLSLKSSDHFNAKTVLESFRLKTVQDLNMLKRLLRRAENDYYSLYKAYRFLRNSGYHEALLHHVRQEAVLTSNEEMLEVINCLHQFVKVTDTECLSVSS